MEKVFEQILDNHQIRLRSKKAFNYYKKHYDFTYVDIQGKYKNVPIKKFALDYILNGDQYVKFDGKYPYESYCNGFADQYEKGIPEPRIKTVEQQKETILQYILPNPYYPATPFNEQNAYKHGEETALQYLAWQIIINEFMSFESVFEVEEVKHPLRPFFVESISDEQIIKIEEHAKTIFSQKLGFFLHCLLIEKKLIIQEGSKQYSQKRFYSLLKGDDTFESVRKYWKGDQSAHYNSSVYVEQKGKLKELLQK
jgi:hypothetical protein